MSSPTIDQVLRPITSICLCPAKPTSCELHIQARKIGANLQDHVAATNITKPELFAEVVAVTQLEQRVNNSMIPRGIDRQQFMIALVDEVMTIMQRQQERAD